MKHSSPRAVGIILSVFGLVVLILLGVAQSGETRLNDLAIAGVWLIGLIAVAVGLFMAIKNRRVRMDGRLR